MHLIWIHLRLWIFIELLALQVLSACSPQVEPVPIEGAQAWLQSIEDLPDRSKSQRCSLALRGCAAENEFDPNTYFLVFDHMSMEVGYTLDEVHVMDGVGSRPVVYARRIDQIPYTSYLQFATASRATPQGSYETIEHSDDYLDHVQIDGTPEGYFQYVALSIIDDQYQLYWHGLYNDTTIVTSAEQGIRLVEEAEQEHGFDADDQLAQRTEKIQGKISKLDFTPYVEVGESRAVVRLITFTKWGGFREVRVTLSAAFPHKVLSSHSRLRVSYNWGVLY